VNVRVVSGCRSEKFASTSAAHNLVVARCDSSFSSRSPLRLRASRSPPQFSSSPPRWLFAPSPPRASRFASARALTPYSPHASLFASQFSAPSSPRASRLASQFSAPSSPRASLRSLLPHLATPQRQHEPPYGPAALRGLVTFLLYPSSCCGSLLCGFAVAPSLLLFRSVASLLPFRCVALGLLFVVWLLLLLLLLFLAAAAVCCLAAAVADAVWLLVLLVLMC
jgi:hypothetical protein